MSLTHNDKICAYAPCNAVLSVPKEGRSKHQIYCKTAHRVLQNELKRVIKAKDEERNFILDEQPVSLVDTGHEVREFIRSRLGKA